jgi:hypothetical protein
VNESLGLERMDHIVNNVPNLFEAIDYFMNATGFHEFSEFTAEDVGTVDSGLNSLVMANNNEFVLMPVNEPTFGTPRKSQIQNYLEHNSGPGIVYDVLASNDGVTDYCYLFLFLRFVSSFLFSLIAVDFLFLMYCLRFFRACPSLPYSDSSSFPYSRLYLSIPLSFSQLLHLLF